MAVRIEDQSGEYWRNLQVSYDAINEMEKDKQKSYMKVILNSMQLKGFQELAIFFEIDIEKSDTKEEIWKKLLLISDQDRKLILLLNDFQRRKKKSIANYYGSVFSDEEHTITLIQLYRLFQESSDHLFSILAYHFWVSRGSGTIYELDKEIDSDKALKILTEKSYESKLCMRLYEAANRDNEYRIFSHVVMNENQFIGLLYKQVKDISVPDYSQAVRNKGIEVLLFGIDVDSNTIEIKTKPLFEVKAIKECMEEIFWGELAFRKENVFKDYEKENILETMLSEKTASGEIVGDFLINKISFRSSPIKNSPEITLHTKNMDIWPSVADAHEKNAVTVKSLKDLQFISFKSMHISRTIRSIIKDDGNIIFTMDDSRLAKETLKTIKSKFFQKFGVPLFQEIVNHKFSDGKADLVDYVMGQYMHDIKQDDEMKQVYQELIDKELLVENEVTYVDCIDPECPHKDHQLDVNESSKECPICHSEIELTKELVTDVVMKKIERRVKQQIKGWGEANGWTMYQNSKLTYGEKVLEFIKIERRKDEKILQFLIADGNVDKRLLNKLHKMLTPLIVIFVGQSEKLIEHYSDECIQAITYGKLYTQTNESIKVLFEEIQYNLELRAKQYIASGANKGYHSIQKILGDPANINRKEYTAGDFEDDGYALIKDMFPNSVKWGKEQSGKAVPEGVFSISYLKHGKEKESYAFSFDFKLSYQNKGYPLEISERRKATEYVNVLNNSDSITSFTNSRELTGHIFISNRFNDSQIDSLVEHFSEHLEGNVHTKPICMTIEALAYLHAKYRDNMDVIELNKNYYLDLVFQMLTNIKGIIKSKHIDALYEEILSRKQTDIDSIDMHRLTREARGDYIFS